MKPHSTSEKGLSLIELLVTVLILSFVILAALSLFTQAQWLQLGADERSDMQNHARVIMETMERDFRMIGYGVPTGNDIGGATTYADKWDVIFAASVKSIGFTADIDNGNTILRQDAGSSAANEIIVENANYYANVVSNPQNILLINNGKKWIDLTVNNISGTTLRTSVNITSPTTFASATSEIVTLERVFYEMTGDTNNDGVCDQPYPFCTIRRQEFTTNNPTSATETANSGLWGVLGDKVYSLNLQYQDGSGNVLNPSTPSQLPSIAKIIITLVCRNRGMKVQEYQDARLTSHILVRNRSL